MEFGQNLSCPHVAKVGLEVGDDPEISAVKVIEQSDIVISIPFTSTALIARSLGKASAYYDPTGMIAKNDAAGHGIPLLSNYKELFHWVSEVCDEKKIN